MKYIFGNWKMNMMPAKAEKYYLDLNNKLDLSSNNKEVVVFMTDLQLGWMGAKGLFKSKILIGAQDMFCEGPEGAYTGEVSGEMLKKIGVNYVLIGHSERRQIIGEGLELLDKKLKKALTIGLKVVFCVGETWEQRQSGNMTRVLREQLESVKKLSSDLKKKVIIAYEPVWAIGTGKNASSDDVVSAAIYIKKRIGNLPVLYGGSVNSKNVQDFSGSEVVDGLLVGGASLKLNEFSGIYNKF